MTGRCPTCHSNDPTATFPPREGAPAACVEHYADMEWCCDPWHNDPFKPFPCPACGETITGRDLDGDPCPDCARTPSCHHCQWEGKPTDAPR